MFTEIRTCAKGAVAVITAMMFPVLLGFTGLGIEVGHWYLTQRQMQGAADAAAVSAAAEYAKHTTTTSYEGVGVQYANFNGGYTILPENVQLIENCRPASGEITWNCIVVEISQDTMAGWLMPSAHGGVQSIPTPTLRARAVVAVKVKTPMITSKGGDCILALANVPNAVSIENNNNLVANCGIATDDGGNGAHLGGINFKNPGDNAYVEKVDIRASQEPCEGCHPFDSYGQQPPPHLPANVNKATPDPYTRLLNFDSPDGVRSATVPSIPGYNGGAMTCTQITVVGGTPYDVTSGPAKLTASIDKKGAVSVTVNDPGGYAPNGMPPSNTAICNGRSLTYTLNEGCFAQGAGLIAGRKYCALSLDNLPTDASGDQIIPAGKYFVDNDGNTSRGSGNLSLGAGRSAPGGTTFYLTKGDIASLSSNVAPRLCAPGTVASGHKCDGSTLTCDDSGGASCVLFVQKASNGNPTRLLGTANPVFSGLMYLPKSSLEISGDNGIGGCFGAVIQTITLKGSGAFSKGCLPGDGIGDGTPVPGDPVVLNSFLYQ